jgi:tetratricopeptide (TPR) repeat protein
VTRHNPLAAYLLRLWAYFSNRDVWFELLYGGRQGAPPWFLDLTEDELSFHRATRVLCNHALIEADPSTMLGVESAGYSMHGCVHSWTSHVLNQDRNLDIAQLALQCVGLRVPSNTDQGYWIIERRLLEHANACQAYIDEVVAQNCTDSSHDAIHSLGRLYADQGKLGDAEAMYRRALEGYEKALGCEHTSTLSTVNNLGTLYRNQGKLSDAEAMYRRALEGKEKALGCEHTS